MHDTDTGRPQASRNDADSGKRDALLQAAANFCFTLTYVFTTSGLFNNGLREVPNFSWKSAEFLMEKYRTTIGTNFFLRGKQP